MVARVPNRGQYLGTMDSPCDMITITVRSTYEGTSGKITFYQNPYNRQSSHKVLSSYSTQTYLGDPVILLAIVETMIKVAARKLIPGDQEV